MTNTKYLSANKQKIQTGDAGTRKELANKLLICFSIMMGIAVIGSLLLLGLKVIQPDTSITFILAVASPFSGLLGSAITYYFSSK